ncbi:MAG: hypothetical protein IJA85_00730 [Clostridia bacterium]|nr:hypothetical protein [Clostridia bacterium]MBQ4573699.1 hypothetical protein [Clostridia bacterium]
MIFLKNTGSELFESAYFILNENAAVERAGEDDMIREANRIVGANMMGLPSILREKRVRRPSGVQRLFWFSAGSLTGSGLVLLFQLAF